MPTVSRMTDVDGAEAVSAVLHELLNTFPGLGNKSISFSTLEEHSGIAMFPTSGSAVIQNRESITGHVKQVCLYPFNIIYRASPKTDTQKMKIKEFLDGIGRWLELQPVTIDETEHKLDSYPELRLGQRKIKSINRTNPAHIHTVYNDGIEDWIITLSLKYENEFYK